MLFKNSDNLIKMSSGYSYPGLAQATGTRVDSANRHNIPCKVSEALMSCWCENQTNPRNHIHAQKMKYCMHKNDLVLNVSQPLNDCGTIVTQAKAYPHVVSNLGDLSSVTQNLLCWLYHTSMTGNQWMQKKKMIQDIAEKNDQAALSKFSATVEDPQKSLREIKDLPYFSAMGYSVGTAYACNLSGDTVGTVFIGGMNTVQNGAFEIRAGELVQWYFEFEEDMFYKKTTEDKKSKQLLLAGSRKQDLDKNNNVSNPGEQITTTKATNTYELSIQQQNRQKFYERELGDLTTFPKAGRKHNVFYPKPYKLLSDGSEHHADKIRIFAKCINGGRGGDAIDIMMMTQCL